MSKVLNKIVYVTEDNELCYCDKNFYKTCILRISKNLPCQESLVRVTPIARVTTPQKLNKKNDDFLDSTNDNSAFFKTLEHLDKMK